MTRMFGLALRAFFFVLLVSMPSLMLPGVSRDASQIVALIAIFGAALTLFEYGSAYPGLVEFRDAPPFNRIRFGSLFIMIFMLSIMTRNQFEPNSLTHFVSAIGEVIGEAIDFSYSPVRLVVLMLPPDTSLEHVALVRSAAGMCYLVSLLTLAVFLIVQRITGWPSRSGSFNVWVNLPTFDPTAGGDVVERLERDARVNIALGFILPFLTPAVIKSAASVFGTLSMAHPQTLIWTVAAWAFLPASLFMRGIAMGRIAGMISEKRRKTHLQEDDEAAMLAA